MVLPNSDWKNQPGHILDWFSVVLAVVLCSAYLYLWWTEGGILYFGLWIVLFGWLVVYFTDYWQPILYLVMALVVIFSTSLLLLGGSWEQPIDQIAILLTIVFLLLLVYLFFHEETAR